MRISCVIGHYRSISGWLPGALMLLLLPLAAHALQATPPIPTRPAPVVIIQAPPAVQFQQTAQQQHIRDRMQKSQLQQQLQQSVSDNAKRPLPADSPTRTQLEQADSARQNRNHAVQQDLLDRYQRANPPPPVPHVQPASPRSGQ